MSYHIRFNAEVLITDHAGRVVDKVTMARAANGKNDLTLHAAYLFARRLAAALDAQLAARALAYFDEPAAPQADHHDQDDHATGGLT